MENYANSEEWKKFLLSAINYKDPITYGPCDSPIEEDFLESFRHVAAPNITVEAQHECLTAIGKFRLDFIACSKTNDLKVGIECDGKEFHTAERDVPRDKAIIDAGIVSRIYRLRGKDIYFRIHDTLHLLSTLNPSLFSERGIRNLEQLSAPDYFRKDAWGEAGPSGFPWVAIRYYMIDQEWLDSWNESCTDPYEEEDIGPRFPTIIYWTQK